MTITRKEFVLAMVTSPLMSPTLAACGDSTGDKTVLRPDRLTEVRLRPTRLRRLQRRAESWRSAAHSMQRGGCRLKKRRMNVRGCVGRLAKRCGPTWAGFRTRSLRFATAIWRFEPVSLLVRPEERDRVGALLPKVTLVEAPVDDLWARDSLPSFLLRKSESGAVELAVGRVQFNGWGNKQTQAGDAQLTRLVAEHLSVPLIDSSVVGEGGSLEIDGLNLTKSRPIRVDNSFER